MNGLISNLLLIAQEEGLRPSKAVGISVTFGDMGEMKRTIEHNVKKQKIIIDGSNDNSNDDRY